MTRYNLDEIAGELEPIEFEIKGKVYSAIGDPTQALWDSLEAFSKLGEDAGPDDSIEAVRGLLGAAFGEEQTVELMEVCGLIRLAALAGTLSADYAEKAGKAQGSNRASRRSTVPSKPTSNGSTTATSKSRVGAGSKKGSAARSSPG